MFWGYGEILAKFIMLSSLYLFLVVELYALYVYINVRQMPLCCPRSPCYVQASCICCVYFQILAKCYFVFLPPSLFCLGSCMFCVYVQMLAKCHYVVLPPSVLYRRAGRLCLVPARDQANLRNETGSTSLIRVFACSTHLTSTQG
jgi:hypothetical protein